MIKRFGLAAAFLAASQVALGQDYQLDPITVTASAGMGSEWSSYSSPNLISDGRVDRATLARELWDDAFVRQTADPGSGGDSKCGTTSKPVVIETGSKILREHDFVATAGEMPLQLSRTYNYNQDNLRAGIFGQYWSASVDFKIILNQTNGAVTSIHSYRPDGARISYTPRNGRWEDSKAQSVAWIEGPSAEGNWTLHAEEGTTEIYSSDGRVQSVKNRHGIGWIFEYDGWWLARVVHTSGQAMQFTWNNGRVSTITDPNGSVYTYAYMGTYLGGVSYPGTPVHTRTYHYEDPAVPGAVTGISVDGVRYSNYAYFNTSGISNYGQVRESGLANGQSKSTFGYYADATLKRTVVTNGDGVSSTYTYRPVGSHGMRLQEVSRTGFDTCPAAAAKTVYDTNGYPDYKIDWNGIKTDFTYNAKGELESVTTGITTYPASAPGVLPAHGAGPSAAIPDKLRHTVLTWTADNRPATEAVYTAPNGALIRYTEYVYHPVGHPSQHRLWKTNVTGYSSTGSLIGTRTTEVTYTTHANGMLASRKTDGPLSGDGDSLTETYDSSGRVTAITNGLGHTMTYGNFTANGRPQLVTDANGHQVSFTYDARSQVLSRSESVAGSTATTTYAYNGHGGVTNETFNGAAWWWRQYTDIGQMWAERHSFNTDDFKNYQYDKLGNLTGFSVLQNVYVTDAQCLEAGGTYEECRVIAPNPAVKYQRTWTYDKIGRRTAEQGTGGQNIRYKYDNGSNITEITDSQGRVTKLFYDAQDQLVRKESPSVRVDATTTAIYVTQFDYDAMGNLIWVSDPKQGDTTYAYNGFGEQESIQSLETGTTLFHYDSAGRRDWMQRNSEPAVKYVSDALGRVTAITDGGGSPLQAFTFDCAGAKGRLCGMTDTASGTDTAYTYTAEGLLDVQTEMVNGTVYTVDRDYDVRGRMTTIRYSGGGGSDTTVQYSYNSEDEVTLVTAAIGNGTPFTVASNFTYLPFGPRTSMRYGNTAIRTQTYDSDFRLKSVVSTGLQSLTYTLNANDLITKVTNGINASLTQTHAYDEISRLKSVTATSGNQSWTFDPNGNRKTHTWGGITDAYTTRISEPGSSYLESVVRGTATKSFHADARGNVGTVVEGATTKTLTYDLLNRVQSFQINAATPTEYKYNALNQRVRKTGTGGTFQYVYTPTGELLGETAAGSTALSSVYIWVGGEPIAMIRSGAAYYIHNDHLGRPELVTDQAKVVKWRASNFAYDRSVTTNTIGGLNLGFPGQYYDSESGIYYNWNRYYDPSTARYLQSDPIGLEAGLNTYTYALSNPVSLIDPVGLDCTCKGTARVLQGNASLIGKTGGFATPNNPVKVAAGSAAVIPAQFGGMSGLRPIASSISATSNGAPLFSGITDVIGGKSPVAGLNVRDALIQLNPGSLIIELPSAPKDLGTIPIEITGPDGMQCPQGTH